MKSKKNAASQNHIYYEMLSGLRYIEIGESEQVPFHNTIANVNIFVLYINIIITLIYYFNIISKASVAKPVIL